MLSAECDPVLPQLLCEMCGSPHLHQDLFDLFGCCAGCGYVHLRISPAEVYYVPPTEWDNWVQDAAQPRYGGAS